MARLARGLLLGALGAAGIAMVLWRGRRGQGRLRRGSADRGKRPCGGAGREEYPDAPTGPNGRLSPDALIDEASAQSFPASDAPSYIPNRVGRPAA